MHAFNWPILSTLRAVSLAPGVWAVVSDHLERKLLQRQQILAWAEGAVRGNIICHARNNM